MNQRMKPLSGRQSSTIARICTILVPLIFVFSRSGLSQDFVFTVAPEGQWRSVVCSGDGTKLAAFAQAVYLQSSVLGPVVCVSSDSGATWRNANPGPFITASFLALTPDAATLVAVGSGYSFTSHNLGVSWITNGYPGGRQVALSNDGTKWVCFSGAIYISDDSGASWKTTSAPVTNWTSVVCSGDGSHLAAVQRTGQVFTSPDRGVTWQSRIPASPTNFFGLLVSSTDGNKLVAIGDLVCVSTNAGANWIAVGTGPPAEPNRSYSGGLAPLNMVSASADATTLVAIRLGGSFIWTSTNSGAQWSLHGLDLAVGSITGVAASSDGTRWLASGDSLVYTLPPPPIALSFVPQGTNLALFWPSNQLGFVLESAPSVSPGAIWTPVTNDVLLGNYRFNVTASLSAPAAYYKLHKR